MTSRSRLPRAAHTALRASAAAALIVDAQAAAAQQVLALAPDVPGTPRPRPADGPAERPRRGSRPDESAPVMVREPALVVGGAPRGFRVVSIPVPASLPTDRAATFEVFPTGVAPILGKLAGTVSAAPGGRAVLLTVGVPTDARAGLAPVGFVRFAAEGTRGGVEVPVALEVSATRRIELAVTEGLRAVHGGERFALGYRLTNLGNAPDTVTVQLALPTGWRAEGGDGTTALPAGGTVTRSVQVTVPRDIGGGSLSLRLTALAQGRAVASAEAVVELLGSGVASAAMGGGTQLRINAAGVRGPWDGTAAGLTYALDGHLTDDIQISARAASMPGLGGPGSMGLVRAGLFAAPPSLALWTPSWRLSAGAVGGQFTDLTGWSSGGQGASLSVTRPAWGLSFVAARPQHLGGSVASGTNVLFGQASAMLHGARVTASVSSLSEPVGVFGDPRRLDALSAGVQFGTAFQRSLATEVGYRRYGGGQGLGVSTALDLRRGGSALNLRAAHAPGGSQAFARAAGDLSASASQQLGRWLGVNASGWHLTDANAAVRSLRNTGWTAGATARVGPAVSVSAGGRRSGYTAVSTAGRFGSTDQAFTGNAQARVGVFTATADAAVGTVTRLTAVGAGGTAFTERAPNTRFGTSLRAAGAAGTFELSGQTNVNGSGGGVLPVRQSEYAVRADEVPVMSIRAVRLVAGASVSRATSWVRAGQWISTTRGSLGADLPLGVAVRFEAERNPLYYGYANAPKWVYGLRVEHALRMPRLGRGGVDGVVYRDLDGDGRRDRGEPGFEGVVVRRGGEMAVTDRNGHYRFAGARGESPAVDARSLPMGWVAAPRTDRDNARDFGVVAVTTIDVHLDVDAADSTRVSRDDLAKAVVIARDSVGRPWVARATAAGSATFDALPPGRYTTTVDFSQAEQPLRVVDAPSFVVGAGPVAPLRLAVRPRPLRFQAARPASADPAHPAPGAPGASAAPGAGRN